MPSSVTTVVPSGTIKNWCLAPQVSFDAEPYECANKTLGQKDSDYQTICCDGDIIDLTQDWWQPYRPKSAGPLYFEMDNLRCCRLQGAQQGGIQPIDNNYRHCSAGSPTPLASLAATNNKNAAPFLVTYTSASYGDHTTGDFIPAQVPTCIWMNTNTALSDGVGVKTVTVPAASISTLPSTATYFGLPITPDSTYYYSSYSPSRTHQTTSRTTATGAPLAGNSTQVTSSSSSTTAAAASATSTSGSFTVKSSSILCFGIWVLVSSLLA